MDSRLEPARPKLVHLAGKVAQNGAVSAACFARPRPIDLRRAGWALKWEFVTCPKCKEARRAG